MLLEVPRGLLEAVVALLVRATGAEADADKGRPCSPLEQEDGEDDAEAEAEGGLDEEVGEAAVPLYGLTRCLVSTMQSSRDRDGV